MRKIKDTPSIQHIPRALDVADSGAKGLFAIHLEDNAALRVVGEGALDQLPSRRVQPVFVVVAQEARDDTQVRNSIFVERHPVVVFHLGIVALALAFAVFVVIAAVAAALLLHLGAVVACHFAWQVAFGQWGRDKFNVCAGEMCVELEPWKYVGPGALVLLIPAYLNQSGAVLLGCGSGEKVGGEMANLPEIKLNRKTRDPDRTVLCSELPACLRKTEELPRTRCPLQCRRFRTP
mgnify:CR=1 FL=1